MTVVVGWAWSILEGGLFVFGCGWWWVGVVRECSSGGGAFKRARAAASSRRVRKREKGWAERQATNLTSADWTSAMAAAPPHAGPGCGRRARVKEAEGEKEQSAVLARPPPPPAADDGGPERRRAGAERAAATPFSKGGTPAPVRSYAAACRVCVSVWRWLRAKREEKAVDGCWLVVVQDDTPARSLSLGSLDRVVSATD
jgi:hypothetical protein